MIGKFRFFVGAESEISLSLAELSGASTYHAPANMLVPSRPAGTSKDSVKCDTIKSFWCIFYIEGQ